MSRIDEPMSVAKAYAFSLFEKWINLGEARRSFLEIYMFDIQDQEVLRTYLIELANFWMEMEPKIRDRDDIIGSEFSKKYMKYEKYARNPKLLLEPDNHDILSEMDSVIREALEKLRILNFEEV